VAYAIALETAFGLLQSSGRAKKPKCQ